MSKRPTLPWRPIEFSRDPLVFSKQFIERVKAVEKFYGTTLDEGNLHLAMDFMPCFEVKIPKPLGRRPDPKVGAMHVMLFVEMEQKLSIRKSVRWASFEVEKKHPEWGDAESIRKLYQKLVKPSTSEHKRMVRIIRALNSK